MSAVARELGAAARIVGLSVVAAVAYGIVHDQITARLCVEYFTVGHPNLLAVDPHTASPTVQGLLWGVVATWWVGLGLGVGGALFARVGRAPRLDARDLARPIAVLLAVDLCFAALAGTVGYFVVTSSPLILAPHVAAGVPPERQVWFLVDGWAHVASYLGGAVGGLVLWAWIARTRLSRSRRSAP